MWGGHPGDEQKRRVSSTHRQEPTESSCSTEYDPGLCLPQNTGLTSGILRRKVAIAKLAGLSELETVLTLFVKPCPGGSRLNCLSFFAICVARNRLATPNQNLSQNQTGH